jgi:hypothetical protein
MAVLTGKLRFDLSATMVYLQLMTSLEDSDAGIQNPEVRRVIEEIGSILERDNSREIEMKGPTIISMLLPVVDRFLDQAPPKVPWQQLAADFSLLCRQDKQLYSFGISHEWLHQRMDCSRYRFRDLPLHARVGIGPHAGRASVEDWFLLEDAFFLLASAEVAHEEMHFLANNTDASRRPNRHVDHGVVPLLNQTLATYSRLSVVSFMAFVEAFVNSVAHDFMKRTPTTLNSADVELLTGFKKGRFLSIDVKLERYPQIISGGSSALIVRDPSQRVEPFASLMENFKNQRDSAMHYAPGKEPIWRRPDEWLQLARESSHTCVDVARCFWKACYPNREFPDYLANFNYDSLRVSGERRLCQVDGVRAAFRKAKEEFETDRRP